MRWTEYINSSEFYVNKIAVNPSAGVYYTPFFLHLYIEQLKMTHKFLRIYYEQTDYPIDTVFKPTKAS